MTPQPSLPKTCESCSTITPPEREGWREGGVERIKRRERERERKRAREREQSWPDLKI
jgi:hypothetical protein